MIPRDFFITYMYLHLLICLSFFMYFFNFITDDKEYIYQHWVKIPFFPLFMVISCHLICHPSIFYISFCIFILNAHTAKR